VDSHWPLKTRPHKTNPFISVATKHIISSTFSPTQVDWNLFDILELFLKYFSVFITIKAGNNKDIKTMQQRLKLKKGPFVFEL
jgi:hypothetical protein